MPKDDAYRFFLAPTNKVEKIQQEILGKAKELPKENADKTKMARVAPKDEPNPFPREGVTKENSGESRDR